MIQFNVEEFRADFAKALATRPEVEKIVETVEKRGYDNLVFIGVGGTEIEWRSVLDTLRGKFSCPVYLENAAEFCIREKLPYLTPRSLVITSSVSGDTKEIVAAAKLCKDRGIELLLYQAPADAARTASDLFHSDGLAELRHDVRAIFHAGSGIAGKARRL